MTNYEQTNTEVTG